MAGRFRLYTDADLYGPIVKGLVVAGWDVVRAIDVQSQGEKDPVHFEAAAADSRVLVANDLDQYMIAMEWIRQGRAFPGLITWPQQVSNRHPVRAFLNAFDDLAAKDEPFMYPIVRLRPRP